MKNDPKPKKLDGRRITNQHAAEQRSQEGRQPRGTTFVIHGKLTSKSDPDLQKRIDMVVAAAKAQEQAGHSTDVVNDYRKLRFHSSGFKCTRVG